MLNPYVPINLGTIPLLRAADHGEALCHVVYSGASDLPGRTDVAIEFLGNEDFWGIPFPPESITLLPTRRRSARIGRSVPLALIWQLSDGSEHEELLRSRDLSRHGVGLVIDSNLLPEADRVIKVLHLETRREAAGSVVWRQDKKEAGPLRGGLEFLGTEDFWNFEFNSDGDYPDLESFRGQRSTPLE